MENEKFVHLHVHSEYSLLDGSIRIKDLVARCVEWGHSHVALTDHANMHGAVEFYSACKNAGMTPIMGCEIYHQGGSQTHALLNEISSEKPPAGAFHLGLLAKNTDGYKCLLKLVSSAYLGENLGEVPTVSEACLDGQSHDLVAMSSCLRGEFACLVNCLRAERGDGPLFAAEGEAAESSLALGALDQYVKTMQSRFGKGNFYIELSDNNLSAQHRAFPDLVAAAEHFNLPLVATSDAHYLDEEFADTHTLAVAIKNQLTISDIGQRKRGSRFHLCSDEQMQSLFAKWPEALANTRVIANQCSGVEIKMDTYYLPKIDLGTNESPVAALTRIAREGLIERLKAKEELQGEPLDEGRRSEYNDRLEYELQVINQMGFPDYFLIVQDFINWAKRNAIPVGPGRGSGAGSLVAYALRITDIDPLPYNLIFERFLNPERVSMPDFDVDFCQWRREEVIQYCVQKYGASNVAQITTFGKMQAKGAVKSVGRALNLGYTRVDQFTKLFPNELGITLKDAIAAEPRLTEEMEKDEGLKDCMTYALQLEGLASHTSVHAAGLVISDGEMTKYVPVYTVDGQSYITQYEMKPTEKVGLVKFDFLGLKTLTVIDTAANLIKAQKQVDFDIAKIPLDDKKVYDLISAGHTVGIFQCESAGITQLILKLKPSTFEDVIALVALFRPGPLGSGMVDDFVERKHGRQSISYPHPMLEPILKDTYGMILYQEQVQKIAAVLANYSLGEADLLRRAMGKKIAEEMAKQKSRFVSGALDNKIDQELAEEIFDLMAEFAKYGFNKSHSAAYGLVSYQTAFLKTHYPEEFLAASMTCDMDNTDKIIRYVEDCLRFGFIVRGPDLNRSFKEFDVPANKEVGFALAAIKGIGEAVLEPLILERQQHGTYKSLEDLAARVNLLKLGKKTLQLLVAAGALDCFGYHRKDLDTIVPELVSFSQSLHEAKEKGQMDLFSSMPEEEDDVLGAPWAGRLQLSKKKWELDDLFTEKKLLGFFLSGHPLDFYTADVVSFAASSLINLRKIAPLKLPPEQGRGRKGGKAVSLVTLLCGVKYRRTKKGTLMAYVHLEEPGLSFEAMMFEEQINSCQFPPDGTPVLVNGQVELTEGGQVRLMIERIDSLEEVRCERVKALRMEIDCRSLKDESLEWINDFKSLISQSKGPTPVGLVLEYEHTNAFFSLPKHQLELSNNLLTQIAKICPQPYTIVYKFDE